MGSFRPNPFMLFDMLGNAQEWVENCWNSRYAGAPINGSAWATGNCNERVKRGGVFAQDPFHIRVTTRDRTYAHYHAHLIGFRVARDL